MTEVRSLIEELKVLVGKSDSKSVRRLNEIAEWFRNNPTDDNVKLFREFLDKGLDGLKNEMCYIEQCIKEEIEKKEIGS